MDFLIKYRDKFRLTAIGSALFFNFLLIYSSWSGDETAWTTTFIIAATAIISALVCHITQDIKQPKLSEQ